MATGAKLAAQIARNTAKPHATLVFLRKRAQQPIPFKVSLHHSNHSTLGSVAQVLHEMLMAKGISPEPVFARAGVRLPALNNPENRLRFPELEALLRAAREATGDPAFALHFGELVHPTTFHALGLALLSSSNIRAFCKRLERYYKFITSNETIRLRDCDEGLEVRLIAADDVIRSDIYPSLVQGSFSTYAHWLRAMYRHDYAPARLTFSFPAPCEPRAFESFFRAPCEFDTEADVLVIAEADLDVPLPAANAELARMHDEVVVKFLAKMDERDLVRRVHAEIIQRLPSGECNKPIIAFALNMSVRTLHNRLAQQQTSYQQILLQTRQELAEQYMEQQSLSVSEIAYTLGFSDCSNFSRAFQRWTGMSPTRYRESLTAAS